MINKIRLNEIFQIITVMLLIGSSNLLAQNAVFDYVNEGKVDSLEVLISNGVDIDIRNQENIPLIISAIVNIEDSALQYNIIKVLVEAGVNLNVTVSEDKWTPLLIVARRKEWHLVKYFIEKGAAIDATNAFKEDIVFFLKRRCQQVDYLLELVKKYKVAIDYISDKDGQNLLDIACNCRQKQLFEYVLKSQKKPLSDNQIKLSIEKEFTLYNRALANEKELAQIYMQYDKSFRRNCKKLKKIKKTNDFEFGQKLEKFTGKPSIYIFNPDYCVPCKELIQEILSSKSIRRTLRKKYNVVWLSGDSKISMSKLEQEIFKIKYSNIFEQKILLPPNNEGTKNWYILNSKFDYNEMPFIVIPSKSVYKKYSQLKSVI